MKEEILIPGELRLFRGVVNPNFAADVLAEITPFLKCQLTYSRGWPARVTQNHKMARFGAEGVTYSYKDTEKPVHPWNDTPMGYLTYYRDVIRELIGWEANCVVANTYTGEGDLHPHRDSEYIPQLGKNPTIVSVSFGETRRFLIWELDEKGKRKKVQSNGQPYHAIPLEPGDILVMEGEFDAKYHHGIKPEPHRTGIRLSLTYRRHI